MIYSDCRFKPFLNILGVYFLKCSEKQSDLKPNLPSVLFSV